MSATLQEGMFAQYFGGCPVVYVTGRTYKVHDHFIEDIHKLVAQGQRMQHEASSPHKDAAKYNAKNRSTYFLLFFLLSMLIFTSC
jgi:HrpA-like RNA helicase